MPGKIPYPQSVYIIAESGQEESDLTHQGRLNWCAYILMDVEHPLPSPFLSFSQFLSFPGISQKSIDANLQHGTY